MPNRRITITLSVPELRLVLEGLDSHEYWELSDEQYRSDGFVIGDGSADRETRAQIGRVRALYARIESEVRKHIKPTKRSRSATVSG